MDVNWLLLSTLYSTVGLGMFIYGRNVVRYVPVIAGIALMFVPYFFDSLLWMSVVCVLLMSSPFILNRSDL